MTGTQSLFSTLTHEGVEVVLSAICQSLYVIFYP
jgi:hypothetical protein